jgi:REP element-mobilizing transposase RayT
MQKTVPLEPGHYYHIYNRGNNREDIFREEQNYSYFLKLYAKHIEPVAEAFAYCLLKNHFHLSVRIKTSIYEEQTSRVSKTREVSSGDPSQSFSNFFNAYAKAFNKTYNRTGRLFQERFGRILVTSDRYFVALIRYIHRNPQKHGFVTDFRDWPYSSYHAHLSANTTRLKRDEVLSWFDGKEGFAKIHESHLDDKIVLPLVPDDFD